jgi:RNA polymerase sigma-70 factor (ECF subfamily)
MPCIGRPAFASDEEAIAAVLAGDRRSFEHIVHRHRERIFRIARAITHDDEEADDVRQQVYARAYEHLGRLEIRASLASWLTRVTVHESLARVRRLRRFDVFDPEADDVPREATSLRTPEELISEAQLQRALVGAINSLPRQFRMVFLSRIVDGKSGTETAAQLGISEETVKTRLHRARAKLKLRLAAARGPARARS